MKANVVAKDLRSPKYRMRKEKAKRGKGSFNRSKLKFQGVNTKE
jgi:stalled ribosome alternative rescue factor ArfA